LPSQAIDERVDYVVFIGSVGAMTGDNAVIGPDGRVLHKWTDPKQGPEAAIKALKAM
jgi:hypothetical protein